MVPSDDSAPDPTLTLLETYSALNSATITTLNSLPSALEFLRFVAQNRPFVVRGGAADWKAVREWNVETLKKMLEGVSVNVAVTPKGNADSPVPSPTDPSTLLFVKPHEEQQPFATFLDFVIAQEKYHSSSSNPRSRPLGEKYENDNLPQEYSLLSHHVPPSIPFALIALGSLPDATNLWIGNSLSTTALHKDNYENIYVQIVGRKRFLLLPPVAWAAVAEKVLRPASYVRRQGQGLGDASGWGIKEEEGEGVPFATWDPDSQGEGGRDGDGDRNEKTYQKAVQPMRVELGEGDLLYLPALWYHKVSQSCSEEGICVAVNYWHDMEFAGGFWPLCGFVRDVGLAVTKNAGD
ncbi:phospholipase A2 protein family [Diplocarpon rosae]|nr:phospholipase A2 protein family [Diplocarpon rosae]